MDIIATILGLLIGLAFLFAIVGLFLQAMDDKYW